MASSKKSIHVRYLTQGESRVPFSVAVVVLDNCKEADGWRRYSKVSVRISHAHAITGQQEALMFASGRSVLTLEDALRTEGGEHLATPPEAPVGPATSLIGN